MKPEIVEVMEARWTQADGTMAYQYKIRYASGRKRFWNWQRPLPVSVVKFLTSDSDNIAVSMEYVKDFDGRTVKVSTYKRTW